MQFVDAGFVLNFLLIFFVSLNDLWEVSMSVKSIVLFGLKTMFAEVFLQMR